MLPLLFSEISKTDVIARYEFLLLSFLVLTKKLQKQLHPINVFI